MRFFKFNQNNSGGKFTVNKTICHLLIIEAENPDAANSKAEALGCYFDGAGDCRCCGDRWSSVWSGDKGLEFPLTYGHLSEAEATAISKRNKIRSRKTRKTKGRIIFAACTHEVILETVEQYAQFMADKYGWTEPDTRIFYANGKVKDFHTRPLKIGKQ
jgi:hypothetical protein